MFLSFACPKERNQKKRHSGGEDFGFLLRLAALPFPGLLRCGPPTARLRKLRPCFFCHRQRKSAILFGRTKRKWTPLPSSPLVSPRPYGAPPFRQGGQRARPWAGRRPLQEVGGGRRGHPRSSSMSLRAPRDIWDIWDSRAPGHEMSQMSRVLSKRKAGRGTFGSFFPFCFTAGNGARPAGPFP